MGVRLKCCFAEVIAIVAVLKRTLMDPNGSNLALRKVGGRNAARETILAVFF